MSSRPGVSFRLSRTGCAVIMVLVVIALICVGAVVLFGLDSMQMRVAGSVMAPTLPDGSLVRVNRQAYASQPPRRGDIVAYNLPDAPERPAVGRIVGLPRERAQLKAGRVVVNGATLTEPYAAILAPHEGEWILKDGEYFVLGDNRNSSSDRQAWGTVTASSILGKAEWVYWPPQVWGGIPAVSYTR